MVKRGITFVACAFALCLPASAAGAILSDTERDRRDAEGELQRNRARRVHDHRRPAAARPRLGRHRRDRRTRPSRRRPRPKFQLDYSGGWKSRRNPNYWRTLRNACARLRRPDAAVPHHRLQGARRDVLGAAGVAAEPADARLRAVDRLAARRRAARLALERRAAGHPALPALDVRPQAPGHLRPADVPRPTGLRHEDAVRLACGTSGRATSTSTPTTPTTAPAGGTTRRSRRTAQRRLLLLVRPPEAPARLSERRAERQRPRRACTGFSRSAPA